MTVPYEPRPPSKPALPPPDESPSVPQKGAAPAKPGAVPPVDEALLLALVRKELSQERAREVYTLIHSHRQWDEAHTRLLVEEFRRRQED